MAFQLLRLLYDGVWGLGSQYRCITIGNRRDLIVFPNTDMVWTFQERRVPQCSPLWDPYHTDLCKTTAPSHHHRSHSTGVQVYL